MKSRALSAALFLAVSCYGGPLVAVEGRAAAAVLKAGDVEYLGRVGRADIFIGDAAAAYGRVVSPGAGGRAYYLLERPDRRDLTPFGDVVFQADGDVLLARSHGMVYDRAMRDFRGVWRRLTPTAAADIRGHAGVAAAPAPPDPRVQYYLNLIRSEDVGEDLNALTAFPTRYSFSPYLDDAAAFLYDRLRSFGLSPRYETFITAHDFDSCFFFPSGRGVVVGGSGLILATSDGGDTWGVVPSGVDTELVDVFFADDQHGWAVGAYGVVLITSDGGQTWEQAPPPSNCHLTGVHFVSPLEGWACGTAGVILHTVDGGWTWEPQNGNILDTLFEIQFVDSLNGFAVGWHGEVRATSDGGVTWERKLTPFSDPPTPQDIVELTGLSFVSAAEGWVVGNHYDVILHTADGGDTWDVQRHDVAAGEYLGAVAFLDSLRGVAVGGEKGKALVTTDGGVNWVSRDTPADYPLTAVSFPPGERGWAVGYGSCVDYTPDAGVHWTSLRDHLPEELGWKNVVCDVVGTEEPAAQYLVVAHYDSISDTPTEAAPGADDNGSGTVAALNVARALAAAKPERTIRLVFFAGEEQGLVGSRDYARRAAERGDDIRAVWNMDMVGYVGDGPADSLMSYNDASAFMSDAGAKAARLYVPELTFDAENNPFRANSDHYSFWQEDFAAAVVSENDANGNYPHYHKVTDTADKVSVPYIAANARHAAAAVLAWAGLAAGGPGVGLPAVRVYPNPFKAAGSSVAGVTFDGVPSDAAIVIYDLAGARIAEGKPDSGGVWVWPARVASGVYLYVMETSAEKRVGKIAVLR